MKRLLTLSILAVLAGVLTLSGCAVDHLKVDYSYRGQTPTLSKGSKMLVRCEVTGLEGMAADNALYYVEYVMPALCINCDDSILANDPDFRHSWGTQFRKQFLDSFSKCGFKPVEAKLGMTPDGNPKPLQVESGKTGAQYIVFAHTTILLQNDKPNPFNFLRHFIFQPDESTLTMRVRNTYSIINPKTGGIIFNKYYNETISQKFTYFMYTDKYGNRDETDFYREYIRARNDCFSELQNKLIEMFWVDMQTAKLIS